MDFLCHFKRCSLFSLDLLPVWMADWVLCVEPGAVAGLLGLGLWLDAAFVLEKCSAVGRLYSPVDALAFSGHLFFQLSGFLTEGLCQAACDMCGGGGSGWGCQPVQFQVQTFNYSLCLQPHFSLLSSLVPAGLEPRAIRCSRADWLSRFLLAFQQAFWLPAPLRLPCGCGFVCLSHLSPQFHLLFEF